MFIYGEPEVLSAPDTPSLGAAPAYTDAQVAQALRESMAQGFSLVDSISGAIRVYGVPVDQVYRAADLVAAETQGKPATGAGSLVVADETEVVDTTPVYSDYQVAQALRESVQQGFTLADSVTGLVRIYDVPQEQATQAAEKVAKEIELQARKTAEDRAAEAAAKAQAEAAAAARAKADAEAAAKAAADAAAKAATKITAVKTYTDEQIAQAMRESLRQGFSLRDSVTGAVTRFSVPQDQAIRVAQSVAAETKPTSQPGATNITPLLLAVAAAYFLGA